MNVSRILTTIDTHTAGGPTRTVVAGLPPLNGHTVAEKMEDFRARFDGLRTLLMCEPRGHGDMSGAVLTTPGHPDAEVGAFFPTSTGYLRTCVHSSIGLVTAGLETGFIERPAPSAQPTIGLETPSGVIAVFPRYRDATLQSVSVQTRPAFLLEPSVEIQLADGRAIQAAVAFSGLFYLLADVRLLPGPRISLAPDSARILAALGTDILGAANRSLRVRHPEAAEVDTVEQIMFYEHLGDRRARDLVVTRAGGIDRSPCGAGTGAMLAYLHADRRLGLDEEYAVESFLGGRLIGRVTGTPRVGPHAAILPEITGTAHITGMHQFMLDPEDPLPEGFLF